MAPIAGVAERRASERVPLTMQVTVHFTGGPVQWTETDATLIDLSEHGMFVRCDRIPRAGQHILVGIMHHERGLCAAWGKTVRFDQWGGFGVQFKRTNKVLTGFIGELAMEAPGARNRLLADAIEARIWIDSSDPF